MNKFNYKKLKYGSLSVLLTIAVVALVVVMNIIFSSLAEKYLWYADMTEEGLYVLSDDSRAVLDNVDTPVKIIFLQDIDKYEAGGAASRMIVNCAKSFAKEYDNITIEVIDMITYPSKVEKYTTSSASKPSSTNIIVETEKGYRMFTQNAMFSVGTESGEVYAFNGEYKITSAILQLMGDNPCVTFTVGHGEDIGKEGSYTAIEELFINSGFRIQWADLTKDEIDPDSKIVVINSPKYDFMGFKADVNEIEKIDKFLDSFGSLMVFASPTTRELPELEAFLYEWGISLGNSVVKDYQDSISSDGLSLVAKYTEEGLGASLHKDIRSLATPPKTIVRYARPIDIVFDYRDSRDVSSVLVSSAGASAYSLSGEDTVANGPFNLMTVSCETSYVDNEPFYSYVMVCGSDEFASSDYLHYSAYGNTDILYSAMRSMGKDIVPVSVNFKVLDDVALDITTEQANSRTLASVTVVPVIVLIIGLAVFIRRKHL